VRVCVGGLLSCSCDTAFGGAAAKRVTWQGYKRHHKNQAAALSQTTGIEYLPSLHTPELVCRCEMAMGMGGSEKEACGSPARLQHSSM
jgi:hypothetical protein